MEKKVSSLVSVRSQRGIYARVFAGVVLILGAAAFSYADGNAKVTLDPPAGYHSFSGSTPIITSVDAQSHQVALAIVGAGGSANSGFNFDGYANGDMIIQIPQGWKVTVSFTVQGSLAHSLVIVPWSNRSLNGPIQEAFPGSGVADPTNGYAQGDPPQTFSFTASSPGQYAMVCAVPGHVDIGMWDEMDVVAGLDAPGVFVR